MHKLDSILMSMFQHRHALDDLPCMSSMIVLSISTLSLISVWLVMCRQDRHT